MSMNTIIKDILYPMLENTDELVVEQLSSESDYDIYQVYVSKADIGRVIGRAGKNAHAIRTICTSIAAKNNIKVRIQFDSKE